MIRNIMQRGSDNKEWVENCFFWGGMSFFCFSRIPVPLYLQHLETIEPWFSRGICRILQFLCLLGRGWDGLGV